MIITRTEPHGFPTDDYLARLESGEPAVTSERWNLPATPSNTLMSAVSLDVLERVEAYERKERYSLTDWMTEIFARRTER